MTTVPTGPSKPRLTRSTCRSWPNSEKALRLLPTRTTILTAGRRGSKQDRAQECLTAEEGELPGPSWDPVGRVDLRETSTDQTIRREEAGEVVVVDVVTNLQAL